MDKITMTTKDKVPLWLKSQNKTPEWLSNQIGITIDNFNDNLFRPGDIIKLIKMGYPV